MNIEKLTPAPWSKEHGTGDNHHILSSDGLNVASTCERSIYGGSCAAAESMEQDEANAEFIALARNAFDVMMLRGWQVERWQNKFGNYFWRVSQSPFHPTTEFWKYLEKRQWVDPFTALVEADKWHRENCEDVDPQA